MEIRYKVLSSDIATRSAVVQYYTPELAAAYPALLDQKVAMVMASDPQKSEAQARAYARATWPCGTLANITFYDDPLPTGDQLKLFILRQAPAAWLKLVSGIGADMSEVQALRDTELAGLWDQISNTPAIKATVI